MEQSKVKTMLLGLFLLHSSELHYESIYARAKTQVGRFHSSNI